MANTNIAASAITALINKLHPIREQGEAVAATPNEQAMPQSAQGKALVEEAKARLKQDEQFKALSKTVSEKLQFFEQKIAETEDEIKQQSENARNKDASKVADELVSFAANIAENIQSIADQMGAYVISLKETRDALQDERDQAAVLLEQQTASLEPTPAKGRAVQGVKRGKEDGDEEEKPGILGNLLADGIKDLLKRLIQPSVLGPILLGAMPLIVMGVVTKWAETASIYDEKGNLTGTGAALNLASKAVGGDGVAPEATLTKSELMERGTKERWWDFGGGGKERKVARIKAQLEQGVLFTKEEADVVKKNLDFTIPPESIETPETKQAAQAAAQPVSPAEEIKQLTASISASEDADAKYEAGVKERIEDFAKKNPGDPAKVAEFTKSAQAGLVAYKSATASARKAMKARLAQLTGNAGTATPVSAPTPVTPPSQPTAGAAQPAATATSEAGAATGGSLGEGASSSPASSPAAPGPSPAASSATPVSPSPTTGDDIGVASSAVTEQKNKPAQDAIIIDNSKTDQTNLTRIVGGGSIPSPVADRGSLDRFNFFEMPGMMKA